jgi:hypothetical protein
LDVLAEAASLAASVSISAASASVPTGGAVTALAGNGGGGGDQAVVDLPAAIGPLLSPKTITMTIVPVCFCYRLKKN